MKPIKIAHLYAKEMNIYGDNGNVLILQKRLQWRGIPVSIEEVGVGDALPKGTSIIFGGGGQDAGQSIIAQDLISRKPELQAMQSDGIVMLMICGMYQLFGHYFKTYDGQEIPGIGLLDAHTIAGDKRIIGNIVSRTEWGTIVGYENHSGKTYLGDSVAQLGVAKPNQGNNAEDGTEGAVYKNVFGSYLHGPMLAKSPEFADEILQRALDLHGHTDELSPIDDTLALRAKKVAIKRPR
jgi:lipid II isoglutaminyl synthase (glutamine-hydrolysing)